MAQQLETEALIPHLIPGGGAWVLDQFLASGVNKMQNFSRVYV